MKCTYNETGQLFADSEQIKKGQNKATVDRLKKYFDNRVPDEHGRKTLEQHPSLYEGLTDVGWRMAGGFFT